MSYDITPTLALYEKTFGHPPPRIFWLDDIPIKSSQSLFNWAFSNDNKKNTIPKFENPKTEKPKAWGCG